MDEVTGDREDSGRDRKKGMSRWAKKKARNVIN